MDKKETAYKEKKEKIIQALIIGQTVLQLGKKNNISPRFDQLLEGQCLDVVPNQNKKLRNQ